MEHYSKRVSLCALSDVSWKFNIVKHGLRKVYVIVWRGKRRWQAQVKRHLVLAAMDVLNKR